MMQRLQVLVAGCKSIVVILGNALPEEQGARVTGILSGARTHRSCSIAEF